MEAITQLNQKNSKPITTKKDLGVKYFNWFYTFFFLVFVFILFITRSWVGEDAFIFFRYVDNFVEGRGLVFNEGERVEGFTSPLWVFVLSGFRFLLGVELRPFVIFLGLVLSLASLFVVLRGFSANSRFIPIPFILVVTNSAFRDYATSGFETSLTYLLLVLVLVDLYKKSYLTRPWLSGILISLLVLNRPEAFLILFYLSALYFVDYIRVGNLTSLFIFALPIVFLVGGYQLFRMGYYSAWLPNTYYAKKGGELYVSQGLMYFWDFIRSYPITVIVFCYLTFIALKVGEVRKKSIRLLVIPFLLGLYVLTSGGDYMHGRSLLMFFLSWAFALLPIASYLQKHWYIKIKSPALYAFSILTLSLVLLVAGIAQRSITSLDGIERNYINDERNHFTGKDKIDNFGAYIREPITGQYGWRDRGYYYRELSERLGVPISVVNWNIGFFGYSAGPSVSVMGGVLTDPYIARLPVENRAKIGHENGPEWEYIFSLSPTFSYTPFKVWNESAHFKWEEAPHAYIIQSDANDSFVPVFNLADKQFIESFSELIGRNILEEIELKQLEFIAGLNKNNVDSIGSDVEEYFGFLRLYWLPYMSEPAKLKYEAKFKELGFEKGSSSYERFYDSENYVYSHRLWKKMRGPIDKKTFLNNINALVKNKEPVIQ